MADNIVVSYHDNLDGLIRDLKSYRDQQIGISKGAEDFGNKSKAASDKASAGLKETGKQTTATGGLFNKLGAQIAAAFSVAAVIAFGKASVAAFAEAELSARKLNVAVGAGGGTSGQFQTLIRQAKELQKTTIFSDEQIQSAQTLALQFGLTATETERLIPIIADFASATGQDLKSALEAVLRGSEGVARGLKVYGIEVESTGTRTQKLAQITDQLTQKFGGQAQEVGQTTTGAFQRLKNAFNDVEESIGSLLSKGGGIIDFLAEVTEGLGRFLKSDAQAAEEFNIGLTEDAKNAALKNLDELRAKLIASGKDGNDAFRILITESNTIITEKRKQLNDTWDLQTKDAIRQQIKLEEARIAALEAVQADEKKIRERTAKEGAEEAAKAAQKIKEAQEKAAKEAAEAVEKINEDNFKLAEDNLKKFQAEQIALIEGQNISREEKEKAFAQLELDVLNARRQNYIDYGKDIGDIDVQIAIKHVEQNKAREKSDKEYFDSIEKKRREGLKDAIEQEERRLKKEQEIEDERRSNIQKTFDLAQGLLQSLGDLFNAQDEVEFERIDSRRDAAVEAIEQQIAALEEANDRGRLSDKKFEDQKKKLLADRTVAEKKADDERKKLQRAEAEREKLLSLFRIGLILAEAIATQNAFKIIAASAELAIVAATTIPAFKRGTKGKKQTGVGLVGEEGPELLWMPQGSKVVTAEKTRKYKDAIDSMIEGTFDEKYIYKAMIASAFREASRQAEKQKQKTFAENVAHLFNVKAEVDPYRLADGIKSNNKELAWQIGKAVAKNLNNGYKNPRYH